MNQEKIKSLEEKINNEYSNIAGIVVLQNGKTQYESYFNECTETSRIHVYSVVKSIGHISGWVTDITGLNSAGWGLTLSPVDMAKAGCFVYMEKDGITWTGIHILI